MTGENHRVGFQTYGCRSNFADTSDLQAGLLERGFLPCAAHEEAEVYVVNTCTVTDEADKEALRFLRKLRKDRPAAKVVVTGCMAEVRAAELRAAGLVDAVVGPGRREEVIRAITKSEDDPAVTETKKLSQLRKRWSESLDEPLSSQVPGPGAQFGGVQTRSRYHLRIQEGCDNHCTFCIIPATRGQLVSRALELVLADISELTSRGYQEIVLTGTHIGGWGEDIGLSFYDLLAAIAQSGRENESKHLKCRIRLSSIDPNELTPEIIDLVATNETFCPHLHLCFQALSDRILKLMNRRYLVEDIRRICRHIAGCERLIRIGADLITGFPTETRDEVQTQMDEYLKLGVSHLHVFPYSERAGTAATNLEAAVSVTERKRRAARWRALDQRVRETAHRRAEGCELDVILESRNGTGFWGTSAEYFRVFVPTDTYEHRAGARVTVRAKRFDQEQGALLCQL